MDKDSLATVHNPEHPCGIMSMSNVAMNTMGKFTNTRRDFYADKQVRVSMSATSHGQPKWLQMLKGDVFSSTRLDI